MCVCTPVNVGHDWRRSQSSDEPSVRPSGTNCLLLCLKKTPKIIEERFRERGQTQLPSSFSV